MRMVVEQAFGCLKGRWRILLKEIYCTDIERTIKIIHACCILHNLCIDTGDLLSEDIDREIEDDDEYEVANERREETAGVQKREYLANLLMNL